MNPEIESRAAALRQERVPFVHARVVRAERPTSAKPGDQAVVLPDGSIEGFVGGACAESTVRAQSLSLLDSGDPLLLRISPSAPAGGATDPASPTDDPPGTLSVVNHCLSGGTLEIFLEPVVPAPVVAVHGESPIAAALVSLADGVGFHGIRGADGPAMGGPDPTGGPTAVVVASHGRDEEQAIEAAVRAGVPYVGLVASRKRGEAVLASLDLDEAQRASVHTPAGLDIGARTPREVALSILAEIISRRPRPSAAGSVEPGASEPGASETGSVESGTSTAPAAGAAPAGRASVTATTSGAPGRTDPVGAAGPGRQREGGADEASSGPVPVTLGRRPPVEIDLVCGMSVVADEESLHLDHAGHRYWFCGSGCLRAFAADPAAYVPAGG